jgi:lysyl-tRNA synthetase class 2
VAELGQACAEGLCALGETQYHSYKALFERYVGHDPHTASLDELRSACCSCTDIGGLELNRVECLDLLFSFTIEPHLGSEGLQFVFDYPACMSALAQLERNEDGIEVTRRFELYYRGVELANGYQELTSAVEQAQRFAADEALRAELGRKAYRGDPRLVAALQYGLPECAGVALGVDRMLMTLLGEASLAAVQAFPQQSE